MCICAYGYLLKIYIIIKRIFCTYIFSKVSHLMLICIVINIPKIRFQANKCEWDILKYNNFLLFKKMNNSNSFLISNCQV